MAEPPIRRPSNLIYAIVILLAFLAALEQRDLPPWDSIAAVWITLIGTGLAEVYARWVSTRGAESANGRAALRAGLGVLAEFAVPGFAVSMVFLLQWVGVERVSQANSIANGVLLGMLFMLGFTARWFQRAGILKSLAEATLVSCVGALMVAVKLVLLH
jgi:hypothetical protein